MGYVARFRIDLLFCQGILLSLFWGECLWKKKRFGVQKMCSKCAKVI